MFSVYSRWFGTILEPKIILSKHSHIFRPLLNQSRIHHNKQIRIFVQCKWMRCSRSSWICQKFEKLFCCLSSLDFDEKAKFLCISLKPQRVCVVYGTLVTGHCFVVASKLLYFFICECERWKCEKKHSNREKSAFIRLFTITFIFMFLNVSFCLNSHDITFFL